MNLPPGYLKFRSQLSKSNPPEFYPIEWIDEQIRRGLVYPLVGENAAMLVGVRTYPGGARVGYVMAACGDMDEIVNSLAPKAEAAGRHLGCHMTMIEGREGWTRIMKKHGWDTHQVLLVKDL